MVFLAVSLGACTGAGQGTQHTVGPTDGLGGTASTSPATAGDWTQGLAAGPNGPIPRVVVDQFGYRPQDAKVAVFRRPVVGYDAGGDFTPGPRIDLVDAASGAVVYSGAATPWRDGAVDDASGDRAWWFDFSSVGTPGRYLVRDPATGIRSATFDIGRDVYRRVFRTALRTFFYQRAGQEKSVANAGADWADDASHLGAQQDPAAPSWLAKDDPSTVRDLRGGWFDAGDFSKYTAWHAGYVLTLLQTFDRHPELVGDDLGIPESGNGVSDLLDEIDWGLAWLVRAQQSDGSVLSIEYLDHASPPSAARGPSYYGPPTTHATQRAAAALAYAAVVYAHTGVPRLAAQAPELLRRAQAAWDWSGANPSATYFNNDEARQPGSGGLGGGQQETDDAGRAASRVEAAVYLYEGTAEASLRRYVSDHRDSYLPSGAQSQWNADRQEVLLHFADLPGVSSAEHDAIRRDFRTALTGGSQFLPAVSAAEDPYRSELAQYTWGSNQSKAQVGRMFALAADFGFDRELSSLALAAAEDYVHYVHGTNPLGLVYLTTMAKDGAEHSARTMYSMWFADGTRWGEATQTTPGPAPGFLVGGPNPYYSVDACCAQTPACGGHEGQACAAAWSPPSGQPPMKSYLQFNDDWPVNSWEVTENSNGYQVAYLRLLAAFA